MKSFDFKGKTAIITGASSGMGKSLSLRLIREYGVTVYGIARGEEGLARVKEELGELGSLFIPYPMDVTSKDSFEKLRSELENAGQSVDILINGAGILPKFASFSKMSAQDIKRVMDVNFFASVYSCTEIMKIMKKGSVVVNISSASALCPFGGVSGYTASKSALSAFTAALSQERRDISVLCVMPGFVKTNIMQNQGASQKDLKLINRFSSDLEKTTGKMIRKIKRRKKRIVLGLDGHLMSALYRIAPKSAPKIITWVLKKTGLELFEDIV